MAESGGVAGESGDRRVPTALKIFQLTLAIFDDLAARTRQDCVGRFPDPAAELSLTGISLDDLTHSVTLGVGAGLLIGKPLGIMLFVGLAVSLRLVQLPADVNWRQILGVAFACGIGFTMSLFIAGLAFEHGSGEYFSGDRLGVLVGSILSALAALGILYVSLPKSPQVD